MNKNCRGDGSRLLQYKSSRLSPFAFHLLTILPSPFSIPLRRCSPSRICHPCETKAPSWRSEPWTMPATTATTLRPTRRSRSKQVPLRPSVAPSFRRTPMPISARQRKPPLWARFAFPVTKQGWSIVADSSPRTGQEAPVETRPPTDPLALSPLPDQFPRPDQHRKRETRWLTARPPHDEWPVQRGPVHLLRLLLLGRAPDQHPPQTLTTQHLHPFDYDRLGHRDGDDGFGAQPPRFVHGAVFPWFGRSWFVPGDQLLPLLLVQEKRIWDSSRHLLLRGCRLRFFWRSSRGSNWSNERCRRQARLVLDFHPRGFGDGPGGDCVILDGVWFPGRGDIPFGGWPPPGASTFESGPAIFGRAWEFQHVVLLGFGHGLENVALHGHLHGCWRAALRVFALPAVHHCRCESLRHWSPYP